MQYYAIQTDTDRVVIVVIIVIRDCSIFILPLLNESIVFCRKTKTVVFTMTLCIKAIINMEDKFPFKISFMNYFTISQLTWTKLLSIIFCGFIFLPFNYLL